MIKKIAKVLFYFIVSLAALVIILYSLPYLISITNSLYLNVMTVIDPTFAFTHAVESEQGVTVSTYLQAQLPISEQESVVTNDISATMHKINQSGDVESLKARIYSDFDELISLSEKAANNPIPKGWEDVQEYYLKINQEYIQAKEETIKMIENNDPIATQKAIQHIQLATSYTQTVHDLMENKK